MPDPECKRLLIRIADSYAQLARHARAAEEANGAKIGGFRKF
jgi:hypothetical protein